MWAPDGCDFPKQGKKSVGVARQYYGRLGKVANCQAGTFLAYVSPLSRTLADKRIYLPESWTLDKDRCAAAGVPEERWDYRSKTELPLDMLQGVWERGHLKAGWVAADDAFGMSPVSGGSSLPVTDNVAVVVVPALTWPGSGPKTRMALFPSSSASPVALMSKVFSVSPLLKVTLSGNSNYESAG